MKEKINILYLCTGNSCRSQMAEGFTREYGQDKIDVKSAGISPAGINPTAVKVMKEKGVDIFGQTSDPINPFDIEKADIIITLCGDARENCPVIPKTKETRHWKLEDPARAQGTEEEILSFFRKVRDQIDEKVKELIHENKNL